MKNTFGTSMTISLFGESHGQMIGAVLDGIKPGIKVDDECIKEALRRRRPSGKISTSRIENDEYKIVCGVYNGYTTGTPICILIPNTNTHSGDYSRLYDLPRPSHADYTANVKYHGYQDYRGGGHFSGRITAAIVAAGALTSSFLRNKGIRIATHISRLHGVADREFSSNILTDIDILESAVFPTLSVQSGEKMIEEIEKARLLSDSVGGTLETVISGIPCGVGEPWFDTLEGVISHAVFSVPAVKGIEFGLGFGFGEIYGSEANDPFDTDGERIFTKTNNNGGINGGISNGMPILFRTAIKPTPSIFKEQASVRISTMKSEALTLEGRHDPAVIHRAAPVIDAITAIAVYDMLSVRYGTDMNF